ncbi:MAG: sulfatase-like hydrolase/transferase [Luteitalea sp.]|nr:sulfatase-like hydrolase/transferase [Luteitalea sp.]
MCLFALSTSCGAREPPKPNVVLILADDQGWGDLSVHGNKNLSTPYIDSLARDGAMFARFYVAPVCSPTRAELLTGRYHPRGGVYSTGAGGERLDLDEHTIAETFRAAGYATGAFGKWHNGSQHPYHPNARGFDEYYGVPSGHWAHYFDAVMHHNSDIVRGKGFIVDDVTDHAIEFMAQNKQQPFFCYVPYNTPHSPMQVPERFYKKFANTQLRMRHRGPEKEDVPHTLAALAMVENIDWNVGRILAALDEHDLSQNTIVIYLSDNGPNGWRWNGGMKGRKGALDEGGVRVPAFFRWPGVIPTGLEIEQIAAAIDILPTLAEMAQIPIAAEKPLDGLSLAPLLRGEAGDWPNREIYTFWRGRVSVRTQQYRLDAEGQLFDIAADPGQRTNIANEHAGPAAHLRRLADEKAAEVLEDQGRAEDDRPFTAGYSRMTWLPAGEAKTSGGVERSNRFPNSSYLTNWTNEDGAITWDIEVGQAGTYTAEIYYACAENDVGSLIELSFLGNHVETRISEAHDPPLIGAEHDRVLRQESYTKDFRPLSIGSIQLSKGRGPLKLQALKIPGQHALEVSAVTLTRVE